MNNFHRYDIDDGRHQASPLRHRYSTAIRGTLTQSLLTPRRRMLPSLSLTTVTLSALAILYMNDAALNCASVVRGAPGDGTTGGVWLNWLWNETNGGPFTNTQYLTGAGRGDALWQPLFIVNSFWSVPMHIISSLLGPVCSYNIVIIAGYISTGLGMWFLAYYLSQNSISAFFSSLVFAYSGYTQVKAEGHVSGVFLGFFPLLIFAFLWLWKKPSWRRATFTATVWSALAYVDAYYLAFSLVLACGLFGGTVLGGFLNKGTAAVDQIKRMASWSLVSGLIALVMLLPFAYLTLSNRSEITAERGRSIEEVATYAARPSEYVSPPQYNPIFKNWLELWESRDLHGSNSIESTIYLGWVPLFLAVLAAVSSSLFKHAASNLMSLPVRQLDNFGDRSIQVWGLIGVGIAGLIASLGPDLHLGGLTLPMPSRMIHTLFPQMRVFSRLFTVVHTSVVALAAIGLALLIGKVGQSKARYVVPSTLLLAAMAESLAYPLGSIPVWSYSQVPQVYRYLNTHDDARIVGIYPLETTQDNPDTTRFTFHPILDKVLLNPYVDSNLPNDPSDIARGLASLTDPQTIPALRALGVNIVVVEVQSLGELPSAELERLGLSLDRSFRYKVDDARNQDNGGPRRWEYLSHFYDTDVFTIERGPKADAVVALGKGWGRLERTGGWSGSRWMEERAQMTAVGLGREKGTVRVSFSAHSFARDRQIAIMDGTDTLATVKVPVSGTLVHFDAPINRTLSLRSIEPADIVSEVHRDSDDSRALTISISGLSVE